ncbi:unnamed protein product [Tuber melanosporum]|uniref:(Perigord truffle) hypothetical protein n=1 Tax=Tuber melanosporum (strain Mel28) TaxID=656061 RepID=D5GET9_TUBMM|nr:uncharacterized protein GSTUM_00001392001 [Tuber melanosporum]CAZ83032.1 unnamed protein product [Tuber melanosporum]
MSALLLLRPSRILGRTVIGSIGRSMSTATRHDNDPEVLEKNKQSLLRKHAKGSTEYPHWHEELASDAEAFVKSYRGEIDASEVEIAKLQKATKKVLETKGDGKE